MNRLIYRQLVMYILYMYMSQIAKWTLRLLTETNVSKVRNFLPSFSFLLIYFHAPAKDSELPHD